MAFVEFGIACPAALARDRFGFFLTSLLPLPPRRDPKPEATHSTIQYPSRARMRNDQMLAYEGIREAATTVRFGGYGSDP